MSIASARVPTVIACGIICLIIGVAGGTAIGWNTDNPWNKQVAANEEGANAKDGGGKAAMGGGMGLPGMGGGKGAGGKGGGFAPSSKTQLALLVGKLDVLTKKPLAVGLNADQKKQVKDLLAGLEGAADLSEDDAKTKLDALLKVVDGQKETIEAAGFRWPGQGGGGGGPGGAPPPLNPFMDPERGKQLKSLQETVGK